MADIQLPLPGEIIKESNAIARARWQTQSIWEPRIVALVASKVREEDEEFHTYKIPIRELTGLEPEHLSGDQYREIAESIKRLAKSSVLIKGKGRNFRCYNVFSMCGYENGILIARFDPDLKPHYLQLKSQFTTYNLWEYLALPSSYSQKLFEYLKSWSQVQGGEVIIPVSELHLILDTPESFKKDFWQFRRWVLDKAYKDIKEKTTLRFEWKPIKVGRSVESIKFTFGQKKISIAKSEKEKAKEEKARRITNQRFRRAAECSKLKKGNCYVPDNKPVICKLCISKGFCDSYKRSVQNGFIIE